MVSIEPEQFTFGRSLNVGCSVASGDVIVILSAHTYPVRTDFLRKLTSKLTSAANIVAYGRQIGDNRTKFSEKVLMSQWFPSENIIEQGHAFSNNACAALPKKLWEALKYDEELSGLEDIDFARRLLDKGGEVVYEEEASIVHVHEQSFRGTYNRYFNEAFAYSKIFPRERMGLDRAVRLLARNIVRDLTLAREARVLHRNALAILAFRTAQFAGSWRGFQREPQSESALWQRLYRPSKVPFSINEWSDPHPFAINYRESNV